MACQDRASTKAAYRFFSNPRVSEREILGGHFEATRARFRVTEGWVLVLHDTTEFSFQREDPLAIGLTNQVTSGKDPAGRFRMHTVCRLLMHSCLVVTSEGQRFRRRTAVEPNSIARAFKHLFQGCDYRRLLVRIPFTHIPMQGLK